MTRSLRVLAALALLPALPLLAQENLPEVEISHDDFVINKSCRVRKVFAVFDRNDDGVVWIKASGITVEFAPDAAIQGIWALARSPFDVSKGAPDSAPAGCPPDKLTGVGIRIDGQKNVTLKAPRIRGFKVGIYASRADGLVIENADLSDLFRQHLLSTPAAEDGADWLWPHDNDKNDWMTRWGAAIYVEDSARVVVRDSTGRRGQNGILLDRVTQSQVYDNDFSFLSGWGLGLWRSSENMISRNAFDFCVRGYSHGVYNRGQDSAGILIFEQCSKNAFLENSATHGGDCVFGFGGKEALGDNPPPSKDFAYARRGCNDNVFERNDFSYAPAHGIEMTFSFGNKIRNNRIVGNAICGIWGGYSQDTLIEDNEFTDNGEMGYGLERGGVNIEHGFKNAIVNNRFKNNRCGVHLWWSDNNDFPKKPWGAANYRGCRENLISGNTFDHDAVAIHLRSASATHVVGNKLTDVGKDIDADKGSTIDQGGFATRPWTTPAPLGHRTPVGARPQLRGRENIVMTEWGPWDHESPLVTPISLKGAEHTYALHSFVKPAVDVARPLSDEWAVRARLDLESKPPTLHVTANKPGVIPYRLTVSHNPEGAAPLSFPITDTIVSAKWNVRFFPTSARPHEHPEAWKADSARTDFSVQLDGLDLRFGNGGPADVVNASGVSDLRSKLGSNNFGLVAEATIPLPKGKWEITTLSDDGVRVTADGKKIIDNWTWHVPTKDSAVLDLPEARAVPLRVEYFELDGYAVLTLDIAPAAEKH